MRICIAGGLNFKAKQQTRRALAAAAFIEERSLNNREML
jgi:hypothetical protein